MRWEVLGFVCAALAAMGIASGCARDRMGAERRGERLIGVSWKGEFIENDPSVGFTRTIGHTGFTRLNCLAVDATGHVLSVANAGEGPASVLISIDPETGRARRVADLAGAPDVRALAATRDGRLFAITAAGPAEGFRNTLVRIDPATGTLEAIADLGRRAIQGLAARDETLMAYATHDDPSAGRAGLISIDPDTGEATVLQSGARPTNVQTIAFSPEGVLFGVLGDQGVVKTRGIVSLDPDTGRIKVLGTMRDWDVRGIAFVDGR